MLALTISDVKDFMNKLLIGEVFDNFSLVEASVTTFNTFTIDGHLQQDFFDTDTVEEYKKEAVEYSLWRDVKPYCFSIILGKRTPLNFKIVFQLSPFQAQNLLKNLGRQSTTSVCNFYLNIQYKSKSLLCTAGVSYSSFSLDKKSEHLWDDMLCRFLEGNHIPFQRL